MNNKQFKTLSPKLDVVFQSLFGEIGSENNIISQATGLSEKDIEEL